MVKFFGNVLGPSISADELTFDALEKVAEDTLTAPATTVSFTGLDLESDGPYVIFFHMIAAASSGGIHMYYNNDTTAGNYDVQQLYGSGAATGAAHEDTAHICDTGNGLDASGVLIIHKIAGESARCISMQVTRASPLVHNFAHFWTTTDNVTRIDFTCATASGQDTGTNYIIYKVGRS